MGPRVVAFLVMCSVMLAPQAGAAAIATPDPAHDVLVTRQSVQIPVDSIDLLSFSLTQKHDATRAASITLLDVSRRGIEDRLFVQSEHAMRVYGVVEMYDDFRAITFTAIQIDSDPELESIAVLASPGAITFLPVKTTYDEATSTITWKLRTPVEGVVVQRFAFAALTGCDDFDSCQPPVPHVGAFDMAPNALSQPIAELVPAVWWDSIMPEDDGSIPTPPVTLSDVGDLA